jgi:hypothetical protein
MGASRSEEITKFEQKVHWPSGHFDREPTGIEAFPVEHDHGKQGR